LGRVVLGFELRASHSKQVLFYMSHTSSPFCSVIFGDGDLMNYWPWLASNQMFKKILYQAGVLQIKTVNVIAFYRFVHVFLIVTRQT
jgi:hypothetical protein